MTARAVRQRHWMSRASLAPPCWSSCGAVDTPCRAPATQRRQKRGLGIAVSDAFEIVFDTLATSGKGQNLRRRAEIAFALLRRLPGRPGAPEVAWSHVHPSDPDLAQVFRLQRRPSRNCRVE